MTEPPILPEYLEELLSSGGLTDIIRIDREGTWFHNDEPFANKRITDFFNKNIGITGDGLYVIHYGDYVYPIEVEDVPFFITGVRYEGFGDFEKVICTVSSGSEEELAVESLSFNTNTNVLYCRVNEGKFPAKFKRSASFTILERLDEKSGRYYLNLCGKSILLRQVP